MHPQNTKLPSDTSQRAISITYKSPNKLQPFANNARTHSDAQINQIARSIAEFGFTNPVLIDENNLIMAGHGRVLAAKQLGMKKVPTTLLSEMSETQKRAYIIADNKIAENAGWDYDLLQVEFDGISAIDIDFDVEITGFNTAEIDIILDPVDEPTDPLDEQPALTADDDAITKPGDVWLLGDHRIICGDSRSQAVMMALMQGEHAQMVFTDPPYNVKIDGHVCGSGNIKHREFAMAAGEMSQAEFTGFLDDVFGLMVANSIDGSIHFICMDWRHMTELLTAGSAASYEMKNLCVWVKNNGGMGSFYRSRHELVAVFKSGSSKHINNIELGKFGRYRTNVWEYAGVNTLKAGRTNELAMHPTVKPCVMVMDAIKDCSRRKGIVLDPFGGSGTTLIAAEKTGRRARLIEIDPLYVDTTIRRWQKVTGKQALLKGNDDSFDGREAKRSTEGNVS